MPEEHKAKIINDPIHGMIELSLDLFKFIDHKYFQRLRELKQLGGMYYVFPGACHNRFEHCIGTCYYAGKWMEHFKKYHKNITERDVFLVQLAGLCHDLGHGPFSHTFEDVFLKKLKQNGVDVNFTHEEMSCLLFEKINEDVKVLKKKNEINMVKAMIRGEVFDKEKTFMYRIVANKETGIDVDKFDYLLRDCQNSGLKADFQSERIIKFSRLLDVGDYKREIVFKRREAFTLYKLYHTRFCLHKQIYSHRVVKSIELMIGDILYHANKALRISESLKDPEKFYKLTDNLLYLVDFFDNNNMPEQTQQEFMKAKTIYQNMKSRKLYMLAGHTKLRFTTRKDISNIEDNCLANFRKNGLGDVVRITMHKYDFALKETSPFQRIYYTNENDDEPFKISSEEISSMVPNTAMEVYLRVFCTNKDKLQKVKETLTSWANQNPFVEKPIISPKDAKF